MVALGLSLADALARMRTHAVATGQDLQELAVGILDGTLQIPRDEE